MHADGQCGSETLSGFFAQANLLTALNITVFLGFSIGVLERPCQAAAEDSQIPKHAREAQGTSATLSNGSATAPLERRRHPSYQVFARQLVLPTVSVPESNAILVGGRIRIDLTPPVILRASQLAELGQEFGVPPILFEKFHRQLLTDTSLDAVQLAAEMRATVVDYKYLELVWSRYRPPASGTKAREEALLALQKGDIDRAWSLYESLPKPRPPAGLRIVGP